MVSLYNGIVLLVYNTVRPAIKYFVAGRTVWCRCGWVIANYGLKSATNNVATIPINPIIPVTIAANTAQRPRLSS